MRLLTTGFQSAAMNMAIDEVILRDIAERLQLDELKQDPTRVKELATLRLYGWKPAAISIGYFQRLSEEVDTDACKREGVEVVRRMTGGGAVFHEHEITYSIHIPEKSGLVPTGILESYRAISEGILRGIELLGLTGEFVPLNDIVIGPKKISGNAQTRKMGVIVQHGTILLKVDVEKMFELLKVPSEKMKGKLIADIKERVTSLSAALGRELSFKEAEEVFTKGFQSAFKTEHLDKGELSASEGERAATLAKEKYGNPIWNEQK